MAWYQIDEILVNLDALAGIEVTKTPDGARAKVKFMSNLSDAHKIEEGFLAYFDESEYNDLRTDLGNLGISLPAWADITVEEV